MKLFDITGVGLYFVEDETPSNTSFFTGEQGITLARIVIGIAIGIVLAALLSVYVKGYLGGLIRKLIQGGATSPENAKTLYELGLDDKFGIRRAIKGGNTYSRFLRCVEQDKHMASIEQKRAEFDAAHKDEKKPPKFREIGFEYDLDTMHFYVPEEHCDIALQKFSAEQTDWKSICLVLAVVAVMLVAAIFLLPRLFALLGIR